ncbi:MAG TPA: DUF1707 domain-containing protein [Streptosporangiaceae bacterium]
MRDAGPDAEREAVAAELREHHASGRLTLDELNERPALPSATRARGSDDDLAAVAVVAQRPSGPPVTAV